MTADDEQQTIQRAQVRFPTLEAVEQVMLLPSEHSVSEVYEYRLTEFESFLRPELKPLSFTVNKNFFDLTDHLWPANSFIARKGLLQLINEQERVNVDIEAKKKKDRLRTWTKEAHVGLQFPVKDGFRLEDANEEENSRVAKSCILFDEIESVFFKQGFLDFNSKIVMKLKPERQPWRLKIDQIKRKVVLNIKRQDFELAKCCVRNFDAN